MLGSMVFAAPYDEIGFQLWTSFETSA